MSTRRDLTVAACLLLGTVLVSAGAFAVEPDVPSSVDVYWKSTRTISLPGAVTVIVLDEDVTRANLGTDTVEFVGLSRGDTVALAYVQGRPVSIVVHVIERPEAVIPPSLLRRQAEMAHGTFGSDVQASSGNGSNFLALSSMSWSQQAGDARFEMNSLVEDNSQFGGRTANLRTGSLSYRTSHLAVNAIDFGQTLTGALAEDRVNNFSSTSAMELRGAGITATRGQNEFGIFAGTTIPYYFLSLNGTRDIAGLSFHRRQTGRLNLYSSSAYVNIPTAFSGTIQRHGYWMQNGGVSYRIGKGFQFGGEGGVSNGGHMWRTDTSYTSFRFSGYASAILSSQTYPLTQLQSLFTGTSSLKGGANYRMSSRVTPAFYFDHTNIAPGLIYRVAGSSNAFSPNIGFRISSSESLSLTYTHSRNSGGFFAATTSGNRYDALLSSQLTPRVSNSAQVSVGSLQDPLQINSQDQFSVRDTVTLPIRNQMFVFGIEHDRTNPTLVAKLNQELGLLSPALQAEFLANPTAFVDSTNFPPEIKALLAAQQPAGTTLSAATNVAIGAKLRFSPNVSLTHSTTVGQANSWSQGFGYALSYQLLPTLQLRSSLSNVWLWNTQQNNAVRTTVLSAGFQKTFTTAPAGLALLHRTRVIEGRVFRDNNINGAYNLGEPGLAGIEVRLEDGQVATTDSQGRYKFNTVSADVHQISISLTQFRDPVRMTTRSELEADLIQQRIAVANFGVVDFARVMGTVYNDLRFDGRRQPDSKGMQDIEVVLDDGKAARKIRTNGSGEFEIDDVPPGDYILTLDAISMPPNYKAPANQFSVHVSPVATALQEIPVHALRSISGQVLLKVKNDSRTPLNPADKADSKSGRSGSGNQQDAAVVPLQGVEIVAGPSSATTDSDGKFLLRNLPAGDLSVTVSPVRPVPAGMNIPSGQVKLPAEPVQIQGATIVITNEDLLPYLTKEMPALPGASAEHKAALAKAWQSVPEKLPTPALVPASVPSAVSKTVPESAPKANPTVAAAKPVAPEATTHPVVEQASKQPMSTPVAPVLPPVQVAKAVVPTEVARVIPVPAAAVPVVPVVKSAEAQSTQDRVVLEANMTRAICHQLQSLGEIAHCLQQLKRNSATGSQQ